MSLDTKITQYFRPKAGASGMPPTAGLTAGDAGLFAINFAGDDATDKAGGIASIYGFDGSAWIKLGGSSAAASTGTGTVTYATAAELLAGSVTNKGIAPDTLRAEIIRILGVDPGNAAASTAIASISAGSTDKDKLVALNSNGKIDSSMIALAGFNFLGAAPFQSPPPVLPTGSVYAAGDVYFNNGVTGDNPVSGWGFSPDVVTTDVRDMALYDGTKWHHISSSSDFNNVVYMDGPNDMTEDGSLFWDDDLPANTVVLDGGDSGNAILTKMALTKCSISGGTF